MEIYEKMRQLLWRRMSEMLSNGVSVFDTVDALLGDITVEIYDDLYSAKDIEEITLPCKRDYGHYFLDDPIIKSDFCVIKNNVDTLKF